MTLSQLVRALARRWYVLLLGAILTAAAATVAVHATGVYTARTAITLSAPADWRVAGNAFTDSAASLVGFAKLVEQSLPSVQTGQLFSAADTPLYGSGIRDGAVVYVPTYGGQWAPNYNRPTLFIDVVAPRAADVDRRVRALTEEIALTMDRLQDEQGVADDQRVQWSASPTAPGVTYIGPNRMRALSGIGALGLGASIVTALAVDTALRRRAARRV